MALDWADRFDEAADAHRHVIEFCRSIRENDNARNMLGLALRDAEKFDESIHTLRQLSANREATGRWPTMATARSNLATTLSAAERPDEAVAQWRAAITLWQELDDQASSTRPLGNLASHLLQRGDGEGIARFK